MVNNHKVGWRWLKIGETCIGSYAFSITHDGDKNTHVIVILFGMR